MILQKTVFVLGAGASWPYGFPTGPELAESVRTLLTDKLRDRDRLVSPTAGRLESIFGRDVCLRFAGTLEQIKPDSIDQFVQPPSRAHFAEVAKAGIAEALAPLEGREESRPERVKEQWVRYLAKEMNNPYKSARTSFTANRLSVISFNFDRSFEWHMHRELMRYQGWDAATAAKALTETIEVVHVHGQLGFPDWLPQEHGVHSRGYGSDLNTDSLKSSIENLRLASEELADSPQVNRARQLLADAAIVCFLGFGFLPFNIERLDLQQNTGQGQARLGTRRGLANGLAEKLRSLFHINLTDCGVLDFLRNSDFLYD